jgi:hypothetical protein
MRESLLPIPLRGKAVSDEPAVAAAPVVTVDHSPSTLTPFFKLVFLTVLGLTLLSLLIDLCLVVTLKSPSSEAKSLIDACSTTWKTGFGAIVGLIGGKAI